MEFEDDAVVITSTSSSSSDTCTIATPQKLEEDEDPETSCPVCWERFSAELGFDRLPFMLRCAHSLCGECISKENSSTATASVQIKCPSCGETSKFADSMHLRKDLAVLQKIAQKHSKKKCRQAGSEGSGGGECGCCGFEDEKDFHVFCGECNLTMCSRCELAHGSFPATMSHIKMKSIDVEQPTGKVQSTKNKLVAELRDHKGHPILPNQCPKHFNAMLFQCRVDGEVICAFCLMEDHNGHAVDSVVDKFDFSSCQSEYHEKIQMAANVLDNLTKLDAHLTLAQTVIHREYEKQSAEVTEKFSTFQKLLGSMSEHIQETLSCAFRERMDFLCQMKFELHNLITNLTIGRDQLATAFEEMQTIQSCVLFQEVSKWIQMVDSLSPTYQGNTGLPLIILPHTDLAKVEEELANGKRQVQAGTRKPWRRPPRRRKIEDPVKELVCGKAVQVLWKESSWFAGIITKVSNAEKVVDVTYPGWTTKWDERIPIDSQRLAISLDD